MTLLPPNHLVIYWVVNRVSLPTALLLHFTNQLVVDNNRNEQHGSQSEGLPIGRDNGQHTDSHNDDNDRSSIPSLASGSPIDMKLARAIPAKAALTATMM